MQTCAGPMQDSCPGVGAPGDPDGPPFRPDRLPFVYPDRLRAMRKRARPLRPAGGVALLVVLVGFGASTARAAPRVVAVGDVHGDLSAFRAILADARIVDAAGAWSGGDATLVQVGDLVDRGPAMRGTLDFA